MLKAKIQTLNLFTCLICPNFTPPITAIHRVFIHIHLLINMLDTKAKSNLATSISGSLNSIMDSEQNRNVSHRLLFWPYIPALRKTSWKHHAWMLFSNRQYCFLIYEMFACAYVGVYNLTPWSKRVNLQEAISPETYHGHMKKSL